MRVHKKLLETIENLTRFSIAYYLSTNTSKLNKDNSELFIGDKKLIKKLYEPEIFQLFIKADDFINECDKTIDELFIKYLKDGIDKLIEKTLPILKEKKLRFHNLDHQKYLPFPGFCFTECETGVSFQLVHIRKLLNNEDYFNEDYFKFVCVYSIVYETIETEDSQPQQTAGENAGA